MQIVSSLLASTVLLLAACEKQLDLGRNVRPDGGVGSASNDDAGSATYTCESVCARLVACAGVEADEQARCVSTCGAGSTAGDRACVMNAPCAAIAETCGLPTTDEPGSDGGADDFSIQVCENSCDSARLQTCIDATAHADCRARCTSSASAAREAFTACQQTGGLCDAIADCYAAFAN